MSDILPLPNSSRSNIFDYIFFLRPLLHPPVWTIVILGFYASPVRPESLSSLFWLLFFSSTAAGWAYIVNQISDIESDRINNKLYFMPQNIISIKSACEMAAALALITLGSFFILGYQIGFLFSIGLLLGYFYSGKPFYWKNRPLLSILCNGIAHGAMPFTAGFICAGSVFPSAIVHSLPYIFAVIAVFIGTTIPDIDGDRSAAKITPAVALGSQYASIAMLFSLMVSILSALLVWDIFFLIAANFSIPFYIYAVYRTGSKSAIMAVKSAVLFLSIVACVCLWQYAILLVILFVVTKVYYRWRFNISYPSFT